jgi:hypothetical protein
MSEIVAAAPSQVAAQAAGRPEPLAGRALSSLFV